MLCRRHLVVRLHGVNGLLVAWQEMLPGSIVCQPPFCNARQDWIGDCGVYYGETLFDESVMYGAQMT